MSSEYSSKFNLNISDKKTNKEKQSSNNNDILISYSKTLNEYNDSSNLNSEEKISQKAIDLKSSNRSLEHKSVNKFNNNFIIEYSYEENIDDPNKIKNNINNDLEGNNKLKKNKFSLKKGNKSKQGLFLSDSFVVNKTNYTCRQKLDRFLSINNRFFKLKLMINIISLISFIFYIICTYFPKLFKYFNYIDYFICIIFIIEHIMKMILSHHIINYLISLESLLNFLTEIPPFFIILCKDFRFDVVFRIINCTRVFRILRAYRLIEMVQTEKTVHLQIINIILTLFTIIFIWAGIIQIQEMEAVYNKSLIVFDVIDINNLKLFKYYHHYVYFIIVSITTVGYGEIMPITIFGKMSIVALVVVILVLIPNQTNDLINLSNSQTIYEMNSYTASNDIFHIVLCGNINIESLKSFCNEYFHLDHGTQHRHAVILCNEEPNKEMEIFIHSKDYNNSLFYLQGNPMLEEDLLRADILNSKAAVIFTNQNCNDPFSADHMSLLIALYIKKFYYNTCIEINNSINLTNYNFKLHHNFRLCLQLNKPESNFYYQNTLQNTYKKNMFKDQIFVIEELKMNLLSKSCLTPGIISLLSNLIMSSGNIKNENIPEWLKEYSEGREYEIYKMNIEGEMMWMNFKEICIDIYNKYQGIPIALEINYQGSSIIKLNPQDNDTIGEILERRLDYNENEEKILTNNNYLNENNNNNNSSNNNGLNNSSFNNNIFNLTNKISSKASLYLICSRNDIIKEIMNNNSENNYNRKSEKNLKKYFPRNSTVSTLKNQNSNNNLKKNFSKEFNNNNNNIFSEDSFTTNNNNNNNKNNIEDNFYDYENYYTVDMIQNNYLYINEIMHQSIKDREDIINHAIICGIHPEILHFILPLRAKYLPENKLKWIVILAPYLPQEMHDNLSKFPKIIFIQGNPLHPENLFRANIQSADIAVILSSGFNKYNENDEDNDGKGNNNDNNNINKFEMMDAETIFIFKSIKKINKNIKIMTELLVTKNIEFLLTAKNLKKLYNNNIKDENNKNNNSKNKKNKNKNKNNDENDNPSMYEFTSVYASGEVYLPSVVDKISCQTFYNPNLLTVINLLLNGNNYNKSKKEKIIEKIFNLESCNLFLIPNDMKNESFNDMYNRLIMKNGIMPIALYRKNIRENFYYVYTNPKKTTLIRESDFVYVLSTTENISNFLEKNLLVNNNVYNSDVGFSTLNNNPIVLKSENKENKNYEIIDEKNIENIKKANSKILNDEINKKRRGSLLEVLTNQMLKKKKEELANILGEEIDDLKNIDINKILYKKPEFSKYAEIDALQSRLDKSMEKLKKINQDCIDIKKNINNYIIEEISNEFLMYIKSDNNIIK